MNTLKAKFLSLVIFSMLFSLGLSAQHKHDPEKRGKHKIEWMKTELSLSDDQVTKIEAINTKYAEKMKELRKQMKTLHEEQRKEVSQVLTKEQNEKLEAKKAEMKEKRKEHMKGRKGCGTKKEEGTTK